MRVAVLGGGIQGACLALELASKGITVDLYEKNDRCLLQASAQNEGKIHLGFVYANDRSHRTARTMMQGAYNFAPYLRRWIGSLVDRIPISSPFFYLVMRDSMIGADEIEAYFRSVSAGLAEVHELPAANYFDLDATAPCRRLAAREFDSLFDPRHIATAFETPEIAADPIAIADILRSALESNPKIELRTGHRVEAVAPAGNGLTVIALNGGSRSNQKYDHVVNALWEGRLAIDATMSLRPARAWSYRLKYTLRLRIPEDIALPSVTLMLGSFGDVVNYRNGECFMSWYPVGRRGMSTALVPPEWPIPPGSDVAKEIRDGTHSALSEIIPSVAQLPAAAVDLAKVLGGVIFASGSTDIDDPSSLLHERHAIGITSHGCYHSIDTGKYTMAPLFAVEMARRILGTS